MRNSANNLAARFLHAPTPSHSGPTGHALEPQKKSHKCNDVLYHGKTWCATPTVSTWNIVKTIDLQRTKSSHCLPGCRRKQGKLLNRKPWHVKAIHLAQRLEKSISIWTGKWFVTVVSGVFKIETTNLLSPTHSTLRIETISKIVIGDLTMLVRSQIEI